MPRPCKADVTYHFHRNPEIYRKGARRHDQSESSALLYFDDIEAREQEETQAGELRKIKIEPGENASQVVNARY